ncbi:ECF sigma factor [Planctomycetes bacterium Pla163]|uniref:ECF sigma factor n=1 Tax=Rohdeia mirabilis TaxID=2528008 RepID=A0A518CXP3_9BACT|nr:ECF sigma factor [Planctomycetes bacterium Pla163]
MSDLTERLNRDFGDPGPARDALFSELLERLGQVARRARQLTAGSASRDASDGLATEELVNEGYLKLHDVNRQWKNREEFFAYYFATLKHVLVDVHRHRTRLVRGGGSGRVPLDEQTAASGESPLEALMRSSEREDFAVSLSDLVEAVPDWGHAVAAALEGIPIPSIGEAMGWSESTTRRRLQAGIGWLRTRLADDA